MKLEPSIFKSYDIRGIYPDEISEENIKSITFAILKFYQDSIGKIDIRVVIGRDMRLSSPKLFPLMKEALLSGGAKVLDIGLAATPTYYFAVIDLKPDAGIQMTASHNPANYNGLKLVIRREKRIIKIGSGSGMEQIKELALKGTVVANKGGSSEPVAGMVEKEVEKAFEEINGSEIAPLKVVADAANAMAATYISSLFSRLKCNLIKMNFELDGSFPAHEADPMVFSNYSDLCKRVVVEKAALGIAPDGDGDRVFFVDEKGEMISGSLITALVAREILKLHKGEKILFDIRYTMTPKAIIEESGGRPGITKVGHAFITRQLQEENAIFGGESSGHMFFRSTGGAESQVLVILMVLKALSEAGKPFSEVIKELRRSFESGEYNFKAENPDNIIAALKQKYHDGKLSTLDGIAIEYSDWRFSIRTSNTEALLRLNLEARSEALMAEKVAQIKQFIESQKAVLHSH